MDRDTMSDRPVSLGVVLRRAGVSGVAVRTPPSEQHSILFSLEAMVSVGSTIHRESRIMSSSVVRMRIVPIMLGSSRSTCLGMPHIRVRVLGFVARSSNLTETGALVVSDLRGGTGLLYPRGYSSAETVRKDTMLLGSLMGGETPFGSFGLSSR